MKTGIQLFETAIILIIDCLRENKHPSHFNYNDAIDFVKGMKNAGFNAYAQARNVATALGSGPGEGSEVVINLGRLEPKEQKAAFDMAEYHLLRKK